MKISVNGQPHEVKATTIAAILTEIGYGDAMVATALNGDFVTADRRMNQIVREGDALEVLAPRQGG